MKKKNMNKLNIGEDFTEDKPISDVKEEVKEIKEDKTSIKPSDDKKINENDEEEKESKESKEKELETKKRELEGLNNAENKLATDLEEINLKIQRKREAIVKKRHQRREERDLIDTIDDKLPEEDDLSDLDEETIKMLDKYTKVKGLIPRTEFENLNYEKEHKKAEREFYSKHKEYSPDNDADDFLYDKLREELKYMAKPLNTDDIYKLFEKAHRQVKLDNPSYFKETNFDDISKKEEILKKASLGSGSSKGGKSSSGKTLSQLQIEALRKGGFTEEDIKELTS